MRVEPGETTGTDGPGDVDVGAVSEASVLSWRDGRVARAPLASSQGVFRDRDGPYVAHVLRLAPGALVEVQGAGERVWLEVDERGELREAARGVDFVRFRACLERLRRERD